MPRSSFSNDSPTASPTSRRSLLLTLTATPAAALAAPIFSPWEEALRLLHDHYDDEAAALVRTKERRSLSRFRYHNAEDRKSTRLNSSHSCAPRMPPSS